ncbi:TIGR03503 family protein [Glaciecola petra]|uniref:TIGR03503 family protein n=1 Tax=Glaciecola petra TaxID=3075602 RepID=A0ABU2ZQ71_9ALTE|nr:TIGR03503 family protein [Aestuariibacter sp. P117]MDT0594203.1 TIGR03503 family protein [Aestuariibacter sp. P117]
MLFSSGFAFAQQSSAPTAGEQNKSNIYYEDVIVPIGNEYQNSIQLLNNRFRVDNGISEIAIVFFREYGSPPVVLVRPDGSKLFIENSLDDDSYTWFETDTYDMISLKNPMPGPWQAVGDVLPQSRVMVIADITLSAQAIPNVVYSGETLKQVAFLQNKGSEPDITPFREVISLSIDFVSTNNPEYPNFGLGSRTVARFEDNGLGFDEADADGIFTGQFNLSIIEGEWTPIFTLRTPLFTREQVNEKVVLLPNPVQISHHLADTDDAKHMLTVQTDETQVSLSSLILDGTLRYPNGDVARISITEANDLPKQIPLNNVGEGIYKVNLSAYATSVTGRNLMLTVPEYSFVVEPPPIIEPIAVATDPIIEELMVEQESSSEEEETLSLMHIFIINFALLVFGIAFLYALADKQKNPTNHLSLRIIRLLNFKRSKSAKDSIPAS